MEQLSFADMIISATRKESRISKKLSKLDKLVKWEEILEIVRVVDRTDKRKGGAPHKDLLVKTKMIFLQYLYNLSDPELEDQVNDRLSFQKFVGLSFTSSVPDYTTIWRFRDRLIEEGLNDKLFNKILEYIESNELILKKGTIVDATIIESSNRPLSKEKREALEDEPSSQIDTDAHSTAKRGKKYFGYKGHIGVDVGSKIIRKRSFTSAQPHDSQQIDELLSDDEESVFGDSAYGSKERKKKFREEGKYYGILDKAVRGKKLSKRQKKRNKNKSKVRSSVEHAFAHIKERQNYKKARAKTLERNRFAFDMNCIIYNIMRGCYLLNLRSAL